VLQAFINSESLCFFDLNPIFDVFEYFLFLKSWLWHGINIGNELCNTYKSCLMFKAPFTLLLSRQTKTPAATENRRFIIKPAVHEFKNSLFDF
jgi:hypothetical protein